MRIARLIPIVLLAGCAGGIDTTGSLDQDLRKRQHTHVCATALDGEASCHADVLVDDTGEAMTLATPAGYTPADLRSAYAVPSSTATTLVAVVDAYDNPNAENDLNVYRAQFGLPACTSASGCFRKVDEHGGTNLPRGNVSWGQEIDLDLQMVSAICPTCRILLVEAKSANLTDLGTAVNTAVSLGALVVSNSYGGAESSGSVAAEQQYYDHPGVAVVASSGDSGFGVQFPAASQFVTAVGGTHLERAPGTRGWSEMAWSGAGSGCSQYIAKPAWQKDAGCAMRTVADVSAVADPNTGVAVYDSYGRHNSVGWLVFGGTSVAAPIVAGFYGIAGGGSAATAYSHTSALNDVVGGSNGSCGGSYLCTAVAGYDGPTGLGTPAGAGAF